MYLETIGASRSLIYRLSQPPESTPLIMMLHFRHHEGSISSSSSIHYAIVASSVENVEYCRLYLARSHCTLTCPLWSNATHDLIINRKHGNLTILLPKNPYCRVAEGQGTVPNPQTNHSIKETKTQSAMARHSLIHIIRKA